MVKIDLGCGLAKSPGFLGVDRAPMPGVDVVADLNERLPFEDDSVDIVVASHSLEHVADIINTMRELFRICKHGAQVCIIAPYYEQKLNVANPYHVVPFNEHTARFFTSSSMAGAEPEQYWHPHAQNWGLAESDNSHPGIDFRLAELEFFYFPEFLSLPDDEKLFARRHMWDVCDQMMCQLIVWKNATAADEEVRAHLDSMTFFEPAFIKERRRKDATLLRTQPAEIPATRQIQSALGGLGFGQHSRALLERVEELHRDFRSIEDKRLRDRGDTDGRLAQLYSEVAGTKIHVADLSVTSTEIERSRTRDASEMLRMRTDLDQLVTQVATTRDSLDRQQAEYRRQQGELAGARRALDKQKFENERLSHVLGEQSEAVEHASDTVAMQSAFLSQAWADAKSYSAEADLYRKRRAVRFTNWLRGIDDLAPNLPASFNELIATKPSGTRIVLGDDLRGVPFAAYKVQVSDDNLLTIEIGVHVAVKNLGDFVGLELVTDTDRIVLHETCPLDETWNHGPVRFSLDGLNLKKGMTMELRLFSPDANSPIYPLELRYGRISRKRQVLCRVF